MRGADMDTDGTVVVLSAGWLCCWEGPPHEHEKHGSTAKLMRSRCHVGMAVQAGLRRAPRREPTRYQAESSIKLPAHRLHPAPRCRGPRPGCGASWPPRLRGEFQRQERRKGARLFRAERNEDARTLDERFSRFTPDAPTPKQQALATTFKLIHEMLQRTITTQMTKMNRHTTHINLPPRTQADTFVLPVFRVGACACRHGHAWMLSGRCSSASQSVNTPLDCLPRGCPALVTHAPATWRVHASLVHSRPLPSLLP